ncbi:MAG TPA: preprotein translocase subunit YajC [Acidimicrobiales bacterium]
MQLAFLFILLALMWVLLIVPRQREARRQRGLQATLAVGDEVITAGGIHGRVVDLADETVQVEVAPEVVLRIARQAVLSRVDAPVPSVPGLDRTDPSPDTVVGTED